jgi:hypothetical protein
MARLPPGAFTRCVCCLKGLLLMSASRAAQLVSQTVSLCLAAQDPQCVQGSVRRPNGYCLHITCRSPGGMLQYGYSVSLLQSSGTGNPDLLLGGPRCQSMAVEVVKQELLNKETIYTHEVCACTRWPLADMLNSFLTDIRQAAVVQQSSRPCSSNMQPHAAAASMHKELIACPFCFAARPGVFCIS